MLEEKMLEDLVEYFGGKVTSFKYSYLTGNVASETDITCATAFDIDTEVQYGGGCETCAYEWSETIITFYKDNSYIGKTKFDYTEFLNWLYENKVAKS